MAVDLPDSLDAGMLSLLLVVTGAALGLSLGLLVHRLLRLLEPVASRTASRADDAILGSIRPGLPVALMAWGLWLAVDTPASTVPSLLVKVAFGFAILLGAWGVANMLVKFLRHTIARRVERRPHARALATIAPAVGFAVYTVGGLVVLGTLGIEITPILASLGIGGLAVAWALQDTLSNVFAGWWIRASREVRPGHYVRTDDNKVEGYVSSIGWRTTRLRTLGNNSVIIPNAVLGQSVMTNFHLPDPRLAVSVRVDVPYDEDPEHVMGVLLEEAQGAAKEVDGLLTDPPPVVSLNPGFGAHGYEMTVGFHVAEYVKQFGAMDKVRRRIAARFAREGIAFTVPVQLHVDAGEREHRPGARERRPPRPRPEGADPATAMPTGGDLPAPSTQSAGHGGDGATRTGPP